MSLIAGVCVFVPRGQDSFRPQVFGMGILVNNREILTCAHVIDAALGNGWRQKPDPSVVCVCFPFAMPSCKCIEGSVDIKRWFPPGEETEKDKGFSDVSVVQLDEDAPATVPRAGLWPHVCDTSTKVFGFASKEVKEAWESHPYGQWAEGKIVGPQAYGRVELDGLRTTGAAVVRGFSGAGVYVPTLDRVVGMIVQSEREIASKIAQFIDVPSLQKALQEDIALLEPSPVPYDANLAESEGELLKDLRKHVRNVRRQIQLALNSLGNRIRTFYDDPNMPSYLWWWIYKWEKYRLYYIAERDLLDRILRLVRTKTCLSYITSDNIKCINYVIWEADKDARYGKNDLPDIYGNDSMRDRLTDLDQFHQAFVYQLRNHVTALPFPRQLASIYERAITEIEKAINLSEPSRPHQRRRTSKKLHLEGPLA